MYIQIDYCTTPDNPKKELELVKFYFNAQGRNLVTNNGANTREKETKNVYLNPFPSKGFPIDE